MKYSVTIKPSALKSLEKIDPNFKKKIRERIRFLEVDPRHHGSVNLNFGFSLHVRLRQSLGN